MQVTTLESAGNSSKFLVSTKKGEFKIALSFTLKTKVWMHEDAASEFKAAQDLAEAIVSRHDPRMPFRSVYIFAEHNTEPSLHLAIQKIRKHGYEGRS